MKSYLLHFKIRRGVTQTHLVEKDGNVCEKVKDEYALKVAGKDLSEITLVMGIQSDVLLFEVLASKDPHFSLRVDLLLLSLNLHIFLPHGSQALNAHVDDDEPRQRPLKSIQVRVVHQNVEVERVDQRVDDIARQVDTTD